MIKEKQNNPPQKKKATHVINQAFTNEKKDEGETSDNHPGKSKRGTTLRVQCTLAKGNVIWSTRQ